MKYLGIDPGLTGGIALLSDDEIINLPMPVIGNELDLVTISRFLLEHAGYIKLATLESVHAMPRQGVRSMFKFGRQFGALEALLVAYKIPYNLVKPQKWQRLEFEGTPANLRPKERALLSCQRKFPLVNLLATEKSRVPHDGMVDAILMADYSRRSSNVV